jgi:hypothetical protein
MDNLTCARCNRAYHNISNLRRHQKTCRASADASVEQLIAQNAALQAELAEFKRARPVPDAAADVSGDNNRVTNAINSHTNGNGNGNGNGNTNNGHFHNGNNITINVLGKEDMSHIAPGMLERSLKMCNEGVIDMVKATHFNPAKPENRNFRITTMTSFLKFGLLEAYEDQAWSLKKKAYVLEKVWRSAFRPLSALYGDWECDDVIEERAGSKAKAKALVSFMDMCEALNNGLTYKDKKGHELTRVPKSMLMPIEQLLLDQLALEKRGRVS